MIEQIKINDIKPYSKNNKKHSKEQIQLIANSIRDFGFNSPIIIDSKNVIIAGHGRLDAAKLLKLDTVPTIKKDSLTADQIKAYRIADNKLTELSEWDLDNIDFEINDLLDVEFPIEDYGLGDFVSKTFDDIKSGEIPQDELETELKIIFKFKDVNEFEQANEALNKLGDDKSEILLKLLANV